MFRVSDDTELNPWVGPALLQLSNSILSRASSPSKLGGRNLPVGEALCGLDGSLAPRVREPVPNSAATSTGEKTKLPIAPTRTVEEGAGVLGGEPFQFSH